MLRKRLASKARELHGVGILPVYPENIHLTLKFFGDVGPDKLSILDSKLHDIKCAPFDVKVKGVGAFPNVNYIRVVWAGCESKALESLAGKINDSLFPTFPKEEFAPHITIARIKVRADTRSFFEKYVTNYFGSFKVERFSLKRSTLGPMGPVYETITEFELE
jgi:2'-5' RNA ligase